MRMLGIAYGTLLLLFQFFMLHNKPPWSLGALNNDLWFLTSLWVRNSSRTQTGTFPAPHIVSWGHSSGCTWLGLLGAGRSCSPVPWYCHVASLGFLAAKLAQEVEFLPWWLVPNSKIGIGQSPQRLSPELAQGHATTVSWTKQVTQSALSWGKGNRSRLSCASGQEWQQPLPEMIAVLKYSPVNCPVILHDKHSCTSYCQQHVERQREVSLLLRERKYKHGQRATLT